MTKANYDMCLFWLALPLGLFVMFAAPQRVATDRFIKARGTIH